MNKKFVVYMFGALVVLSIMGAKVDGIEEHKVAWIITGVTVVFLAFVLGAYLIYDTFKQRARKYAMMDVEYHEPWWMRGR